MAASQAVVFERQEKGIDPLPLKCHLLRILKNTPCLKLLGQGTNSIKHLEERKAKIKDEGKISIKVRNGETDSTGAKFYVEIDNGVTKDAFELATECLQTWEKFIKERIEPRLSEH